MANEVLQDAINSITANPIGTSIFLTDSDAASVYASLQNGEGNYNAMSGYFTFRTEGASQSFLVDMWGDGLSRTYQVDGYNDFFTVQWNQQGNYLTVVFSLVNTRHLNPFELIQISGSPIEVVPPPPTPPPSGEVDPRSIHLDGSTKPIAAIDFNWQTLHTVGELHVGGMAASGAVFSVTSVAGGFLKPRMSTAQRNAISTPEIGVEIFNLDTAESEFFNGSLWIPIATGDYLPLAGGTMLGSINMGGFPLLNTNFIDFLQIATPANPAATQNRLYFKSDDNLYKLNSAGVEVQVGDPLALHYDGSNQPTADINWGGFAILNASSIGLGTFPGGSDPANVYLMAIDNGAGQEVLTISSDPGKETRISLGGDITGNFIYANAGHTTVYGADTDDGSTAGDFNLRAGNAGAGGQAGNLILAGGGSASGAHGLVSVSSFSQINMTASSGFYGEAITFSVTTPGANIPGGGISFVAGGSSYDSSNGGAITIYAGGSTGGGGGGRGGQVIIASGAGSSNNRSGDFYIITPDSGHEPGGIFLTAGSAQFIDGGDITLQAGNGGIGGSGHGGRITLTAGAAGGGTIGAIFLNSHVVSDTLANFGVDDSTTNGSTDHRFNNAYLKGGLVIGDYLGASVPYGSNSPFIAGSITAGNVADTAAFFHASTFFNGIAQGTFGFIKDGGGSIAPGFVNQALPGDHDIYFSLSHFSSAREDLLKFGSDGSFTVLSPTGKIVFGNYILTPSEFDAGLSGASKTITLSDGSAQLLTLDASTVLTLADPQVGGAYMLRLLQGGAGSNTITWPGNVKWSGGTAPVLSTTVGKIDLVNVYYDGVDYYGNFTLNY